jgi:ankyrin repeat protein
MANASLQDEFNFLLFETVRQTPELEKCRALVAARPELLRMANAHGTTALMAAASQGSAAMVEMLLKAGAPWSPTDEFGEDALHKAAAVKHGFGRETIPDTIRLLVAYGAQVNRPALVTTKARPGGEDMKRFRPLHFAAYSGWTDTIDVLVGLGADVDAPVPGRKGWRPLHAAVAADNRPAAMKLLSRGANPRKRDGNYQTPYDMALRNGSTADLCLLLEPPPPDIDAIADAFHEGARRKITVKRLVLKPKPPRI